ncbi:MAG: CapA family protein, partial [Clostridia bacterium]|nr:CapA family protein [Clostridia bacterium]
MKLPKMSFAAAGDMLIQRLIPTDYEGFDKVSQHISRADAKFFNLETTIHRGGYYGNQFNGGSNLRADPKVLDIAKEFGFNMLSFANNHTFDFGYGGLEATLDAVNEAGFTHAGVGMNLDEASAPGYLDTKKGRVAIIGMVSSIVNEAAMAGRQSRRVVGRPGINGLRIEERIEVTPDQYEVLRTIADESGVNAAITISRAEGYTAAKTDDLIEFGRQKLKFFAGDKLQYHTYCSKADMARLERAIFEAKAQADYILVSIHAHELAGRSKETPGEFLVEFAHRAIDMGAHAVIGHGPHLLRPLEIYNGRPIFYSLGDFVLHNESMTSAPEEMYEKQGLTSDDPLCEIFRKRSANYTRGLLADRKMMESVVPYFEMEDGVLTHLELLPVALGVEEPRYRNGNPKFAPDRGII